MSNEAKISSTRQRISEYFLHYEVVKSDTASRMGFDNTVYCPDVEYRARALAENVLDKVREQFGPFSPTSWYRCEDLERYICDKSYRSWCSKRGLDPDKSESWQTYFMRKQHPSGAAADIEVPGVSNDELFEWIKDNLEFDQLIREFHVEGQPMSGWVHVSWSFDKNRNHAFVIG